MCERTRPVGPFRPSPRLLAGGPHFLGEENHITMHPLGFDRPRRTQHEFNPSNARTGGNQHRDDSEKLPLHGYKSARLGSDRPTESGATEAPWATSAKRVGAGIKLRPAHGSDMPT